MKFASDFLSSKATWTSVIAIVTALDGGFTHQLSWVQVGFAVLVALQAAFIRDTIAKHQERVVDALVVPAKGGD